MDRAVLTVTLNPAVDKIVCVDRLGWGQEARASRILLCAGGKGINVSRALQNLGIKTKGIGFCGGVSGRWLEQELPREGIPFKPVRVLEQTRINLTLVGNSSKLYLRVLEPGPKISAREAEEFERIFFSIIPRFSYVVLSGQLPQGLKENYYARLILALRKRGRKVILDTSGKPLAAGLRARPFLVKPNQEEAESVVGYKLKGLSQVKQAVQSLIRRGAENAFITLGREGAVGADGKAFWLAKAFRSNAEPLVAGCGDAFIAGFLYGQIRGASFADSFTLAVAAGAVNVGSARPGNIREAQVVRLAQKIHLKKIS